MSAIRVAAAAWKLRAIRGDGDFYGHFHDLVAIAHDEGADVVVIPEGHILELVHLAPDIEEHDVPKYLIQFASEIETWIDRISRSSGLVIVGGSHLRETRDGIQAVCAVGNGDEGLVLVEKNKLTAYEQTVWRLSPGRGIAPLPDGRLAVLLGFDAQFPEAARIAAERGAEVLAVPAWSRDTRSFQALRWCAQARAVENQMFVVHAALVGDLGRDPVDATVGSAAIIAPSVAPFAERAILGESELGEEAVLVRTLDLDLLEEARLNGPARNWLERSAEGWSAPNLKLEDESA